MERSASPWTTAPLAGRVARDATAAQVADATVATWQDIDAALSPIIGSRGVTALYTRSLYLTAPAHPWLAGMHQGSPKAMDLAALRSVVAQQDSSAAAHGALALLRTFHQLLGSLIGPTLTERLLHPVWAAPSGSRPAQDGSR